MNDSGEACLASDNDAGLTGVNDTGQACLIGIVDAGQ